MCSRSQKHIHLNVFVSCFQTQGGSVTTTLSLMGCLLLLLYTIMMNNTETKRKGKRKSKHRFTWFDNVSTSKGEYSYISLLFNLGLQHNIFIKKKTLTVRTYFGKTQNTLYSITQTTSKLYQCFSIIFCT
jgi:hypothetical protein